MPTITFSSPEATKSRVRSWLRGSGIDPHVVYALEISFDIAIVHRYQLDAAGKKFVDPQTDDVAIEVPLILPFSEADAKRLKV